ncbi:MAG: hypothetical protein GY746_17465 [Gammaproteobacteria bacterium]|nr:hypothetical protein [Gammaproteobacteria bacterium]
MSERDWQHNPETGEEQIWRDGGWRAPTRAEVSVAEKGSVWSGAEALLEGATGAQMIGGLALNMVSPGAGQAFIDRSMALTDKHPVVSLLPAAGSVAALAKTGTTSMASRVAARTAGVRTAGNVAPTQGLKTATGLAKGPQDFVPEVFKGVVRGIEGGIQAVPGARILLDSLRIQRQKVAGKALGRWLGVSDDTLHASKGRLTDDVIEETLAKTDEMYAGISNDITENVSTSQFNGMVDDAAERGLLIEDKANLYKASTNDIGDKVIALRSELRKAQRGAKDTIERQHIEQAIDNIQKILDEKLAGTASEQVAKTADKYYARWMQMRNSNAIRADGTIARNATSQMLKRNDPRTMLGQRGNLDDETQVLVDTMKDWGKLGPEMPSSGTAERAAAAAALMGTGGSAAIF